jgi:hypothetical protein
MSRRMAGPQSRSEGGGEKKSLPLPGMLKKLKIFQTSIRYKKDTQRTIT